MALTFAKLFSPAQLTGSAATYYTVPTTPTTSLLMNGRVRFTNTDTNPHQVTAYAVVLAGSASAANCICNAESIAANTHLDLDIPQLAQGDFLQAFADTASKVTISALSGVLFS